MISPSVCILVFLCFATNLLCISAYYECHVEHGIDYTGNDINSFTAFNEASCHEACGMDYRCQAWSFAMHHSKCYIKAVSNTNRRRNRNVVSCGHFIRSGGYYPAIPGTGYYPAIPGTGYYNPEIPYIDCDVEFGIDYYSNDLSAAKAHDYAECHMICQLNYKCKAWVYLQRINKCHLKRVANTNRRVNSELVSCGYVGRHFKSFKVRPSNLTAAAPEKSDTSLNSSDAATEKSVTSLDSPDAADEKSVTSLDSSDATEKSVTTSDSSDAVTKESVED